MEATHLRESHDAPVRGRLDFSWARAVVAERLMWARGVVVREVRAEQAAEMPLVEHDEVVEAFSPAGADDPLGERSLPWGVGRDENLVNAQAVDAVVKDVAIDRVAIPEQIRWRRLVGERVHDLLGGPGSGRVVGDIDVQEFATVMAEDNEAKEQPEGEGRDDEEVDGHHLRDVRLQEDAPTRRGGWRRPAHVLGHREGGDLVAEEREFRLNAAPAPSGVSRAMRRIQTAEFGVDRRTAARS